MSNEIRAPWTVEAKCFVDDCDGKTVCLPQGVDGAGTSVARASLIAAAPELYEALPAILTNPISALPSKLVNRSLAALAKAEGKEKR